MLGIADIKERECVETPLLLFDCWLPSGDVHHWSTHTVTVGSVRYEARILLHNAFDMRSSSDDATDGAASVTVTLANADSYLSYRKNGWLEGCATNDDISLLQFRRCGSSLGKQSRVSRYCERAGRVHRDRS